jgi:hypothetical protein
MAGNVRLERRTLAIVLMVLVTLPALSGCIHLNLGKRLVAGPDTREPNYSWAEKLLETWTFQTLIVKPEESIHHDSQNNTTVKKDTKVMQLSLDVKMTPLPAGLQLPSGLPRFVDVSFTMPDGTVWFQGRYDASTTEDLEIDTPMDGDWLLKVDAYGYGAPSLGVQDFYEISIRCLEPE